MEDGCAFCSCLTAAVTRATGTIHKGARQFHSGAYRQRDCSILGGCANHRTGVVDRKR